MNGRKTSSSQSIIENSPNRDLEANFDYASLQTLSLHCSASTTFVPIDSEEVITEIINSPPPVEINEALTEASVIAEVEDPPLEVIDRLDKILEIAQESDNPDAVEVVGEAIVQTVNYIIKEGGEGEGGGKVEEEVVELLEVALVCSLECGEEPSVILSDQVGVGAATGVLEDLSTITIGDVSFALPNNIRELQDSLGGEGACVQVSYSLIDNENEGKKKKKKNVKMQLLGNEVNTIKFGKVELI